MLDKIHKKRIILKYIDKQIQLSDDVTVINGFAISIINIIGIV